MNELVEAIGEYQKRTGLSDNQFSKLVGIDPSTLSKLKSGTRQAGNKVINRLMAIPELYDVSYLYFRGRYQTTPQAHHNGQGGGLFRKVVAIIKSLIGR